ncbi:hypothetical protein DRQ09_02950, partial [candidate division KSB1 bacterium]
MNELLVILSSTYFLTVILLLHGLLKLKKCKCNSLYKVSVIVPARNEENNIDDCVKHLINQDYPDFEIIIVNDRSEDRTELFARKYSQKFDNIHLINIKDIPSEFSPKKFAIKSGIEASNGEIILTTDADCRPPKTWISSITKHFDKKISLVIGFSPVLLKKNSSSILSGILYIDSLSLAGVSAGSISLNFPLTCSGRNLAYRKNIFFEVHGFEGIEKAISGDDDLLLHKIAKIEKFNIRYATEKESRVPSFIDFNFSKFFSQRIRHASKFKLHPNRVKIFSAIIYLFNFALIASFILYL